MKELLAHKWKVIPWNLIFSLVFYTKVDFGLSKQSIGDDSTLSFKSGLESFGMNIMKKKNFRKWLILKSHTSSFSYIAF